MILISPTIKPFVCREALKWKNSVYCADISNKNGPVGPHGDLAYINPLGACFRGHV